MLNQRLVLFCWALLAMSSAQAAEIGNKAAACTLTSMDGAHSIDLKQFHGKVIYVDFWASWCPPCAKSFPFLNELEQAFKAQGLQILGVNLDEERSDAEHFLSKYPADFSVVLDQDQQCAKNFEVQAMPSSYLIDRQGVVRYVHLGFRSSEAKELRVLVEQLLAENPTGS